jgi:hypothetical protein
MRPTNRCDWDHTVSEEPVSFCCSRKWHCTTFSCSRSHGWYWADGLRRSFCVRTWTTSTMCHCLRRRSTLTVPTKDHGERIFGRMWDESPSTTCLIVEWRPNTHMFVFIVSLMARRVISVTVTHPWNFSVPPRTGSRMEHIDYTRTFAVFFTVFFAPRPRTTVTGSVGPVVPTVQVGLNEDPAP